MKNPTQTYNDGVCAVHSVVNDGGRAAKAKPLLADAKYPMLRYEERIVGINRFWSARQSNVAIDKLIRVARRENVSTQDVVVMEDGMQYSIRQIQYVPEILPPSMDLSLERKVEVFDVKGTENDASDTSGKD